MAISILAGCGRTNENNFVEVKLPDFPQTVDDGRDSWEHDNSAYDFTWYVDDSNFTYPTYGTDAISAKITEKTGATIKFISPVTDDGEKLSTMIAGNALPDVISINAGSQTYSQLAMQGYTYPMNDLIDRWAPSFNDKLHDDVFSWFELGNGKTYGFPNFAYSNDYVGEAEKFEPNAAILVREDWYNEATSAIGSDMTTKASFKQGVQWIVNKYGRDTVGMLLDQFTIDGNASINLMAQYFAAKYESTDGKYNYRQTDPKYLEALQFLNDCYKAGFITDANFSNNASQIRTTLASGKVFASLVTSQNYSQAFKTCYNSGITYVPLVLRNDAGDDPILQDAQGMGYLITMVTTNAKRPDKIIKLLEFLYSEEGQRLVCFGVEDSTWRWTDSTKTEIEWTQTYLSAVENDMSGGYGLYGMTLLMDLAYTNKIKPLNGRKGPDIYIDNLKRPLSPYSYNYTPSFLKLDTQDKDFFKLTTAATRITQKWAEYFPRILRANDNAKAKEVYDSAIAYLKQRQLEEVIVFQAAGYERAKTALGITNGWPTHVPGYVSPVTGPHGDFSYWRGATHA